MPSPSVSSAPHPRRRQRPPRPRLPPLLSTAGSAIAGAARTALSRAAPAVRQATTTVTRAASNTARAALRSETSEESSALSTAARACSVNSFTGATLVTMANGTKKPISEVKVGDKVLATDPATGQTAARPVTKLIMHAGKHTMVDVHLADGTTITATDRHPFWDATTGQFTYAIDLRRGDQVRQIDGTPLTVQTTRIHDADITAYNLTVDDIHTYYAGTTPVLVHNSCYGEGADSVGRSGALNSAKRDLGIPRAQQPDSVGRAPLTGRGGNAILSDDGTPIMTREYTYTRPNGDQVLIQEHSAGHSFGEGGVGDQGPHFNVRPLQNTRTGSVPGTLDHYGWGE